MLRSLSSTMSTRFVITLSLPIARVGQSWRTILGPRWLKEHRPKTMPSGHSPSPDTYRFSNIKIRLTDEPQVNVLMRLGVDIGGTKIEVAALDRDGSIKLRRRRTTPADDYTALIAAVKALVEGIEAELGVRATIGVAMPGTLSLATGRVKNAN